MPSYPSASGSSAASANPASVFPNGAVAAPLAGRPSPTPQAAAARPPGDPAEGGGAKMARFAAWAVERLKRFWRQTSSWLASLIVHALLIILLGWAATAPHGN